MKKWINITALAMVFSFTNIFVVAYMFGMSVPAACASFIIGWLGGLIAGSIE